MLNFLCFVLHAYTCTYYNACVAIYYFNIFLYVGSLTSCNDYATIYIATGFSAAAAIILVTVIIVLISCIIYRSVHNAVN